VADDITRPDAATFREMRDEMMGNLDFQPTDDELRRVFAEHRHIVALAYEWGWGDTEVREQLAAALGAMRRG
jgi:hypothetical protein